METNLHLGGSRVAGSLVSRASIKIMIYFSEKGGDENMYLLIAVHIFKANN